jgi:hypothetical protein
MAGRARLILPAALLKSRLSSPRGGQIGTEREAVIAVDQGDASTAMMWTSG